MDGKYTFKQFDKNLDDGYQIYFTYVRNRYLLFKTSEIFPFMENIEYKVGINE